MPQVRAVLFVANLGCPSTAPSISRYRPNLLFFPVAEPVLNAIVASAKVRGLSLNGRTQ
jgi:hypothetical protein